MHGRMQKALNPEQKDGYGLKANLNWLLNYIVSLKPAWATE